MLSKSKHQKKRWLWWPIIVIAALIVLSGSAFIYRTIYNGKIFPGVKVGDVSLAGLTPLKAEENLQSAWDKFAEAGILLSADKQNIILKPIIAPATNPDLSYELASFKATDSAQEAYGVGRQGNWLRQLVEPIAVAVYGKELNPKLDIEFERIWQYLRESLSSFGKQAQSARLVIDEADNINVEPETNGLSINREKLKTELVQSFNSLSVAKQPIVLELKTAKPSLTEKEVLKVLPQARELLKDQTLVFKFEDYSWKAGPAIWHKWLEARAMNGGVEVGLSIALSEEFFVPILTAINQSAQDARFELKDGVATTFEPSQPGRDVDELATLKAAEAIIRSGGNDSIPITVAITEPKIKTSDVNDLGIKEIIGVGKSNFAGSPKNRRHNIKTGADRLNGVLIQPDEEFSLITTLGEIDAESGYLQELVIKDNKTIPEFGGGLCQIGTTTFRVALASGLPILERRNHSYRVVYYEPAGTDATIYDPKPDLRFKNDTGNAILIKTKIKGDDLIFEFWGTKDGRVVEQTKPQISNIKSPPPGKIVETENLKPGEKKCTEKAHNGADAEFTYTVTYVDGRRVEEVFKSHYVPWQEVCLVGVPKGTLQPSNVTGDGSVILPLPNTSVPVGN
jgi:vancomycin resistance protein YoaR